jgi:hypothetical protein
MSRSVPMISCSSGDVLRFQAHASTNYDDIDGYFDNSPFQFVIAVAVVLSSAFFTLYYVTPVDEEGNKFAPGLEQCRTLGGGAQDAGHKDGNVSGPSRVC